MIEIREAKIEDASAIVEISTTSLGYLCDSALVERRLKGLDQTKQKVYVVTEDEAVVGFVQAELYQLLYQQDSINILGLAIQKDKQRKGYGRMLVQQVEKWAKEMNCSAVRLNSAMQREEAHQFYQAIGYQNTKAQKRFVKKV